MHTAARKLHSQRGASMLFALLVFLLCLLAGVAALTAAAANVGRYTHVEGEQQQYYSVASALELLQAQLDAAADPDSAGHPLTVKATLTETQEWWYETHPDPATGENVYNDEPTIKTTYKLALDPAGAPLNYFQYLLLKYCVPSDWWTKEGVTATRPTTYLNPITNPTYVIRPDPDSYSGGAMPAWAGSLYPVEVAVTVPDRDDGTYTLQMTLTAQDGSAYKLNVVWSGVPVTETKTETTTSGEIPPSPPVTGGADSKGIRTTKTTLTCSLRLSADNREVTLG